MHWPATYSMMHSHRSLGGWLTSNNLWENCQNLWNVVLRAHTIVQFYQSTICNFSPFFSSNSHVLKQAKQCWFPEQKLVHRWPWSGTANVLFVDCEKLIQKKHIICILRVFSVRLRRNINRISAEKLLWGCEPRKMQKRSYMWMSVDLGWI